MLQARSFKHILTRSAAALLFTAVAAFAQDTARIPAGTKLTVRTSSDLSSANAQAMQTWRGTLVNDLVSGGNVIAPAGSRVSGIISDAKSSGRLKGPGILSLQLTSVNGIAVNSDTLTRDGEGHTKSNVTKIGGGAAAGALLGGIFGGGKGAAIGAAAGAGAGTAGAAATGKKEAKISAETALTFTTQ
ncbi:MAG TPA: hypothetical protein VHT24_15065 [Pseudacidobacterium sp.]|jgi:hypothetical protein|nr:hypothetical protein [Pseudacidobacterium sp.]